VDASLAWPNACILGTRSGSPAAVFFLSSRVFLRLLLLMRGADTFFFAVFEGGGSSPVRVLASSDCVLQNSTSSSSCSLSSPLLSLTSSGPREPATARHPNTSD
jgi:hypothetical protein